MNPIPPRFIYCLAGKGLKKFRSAGLLPTDVENCLGFTCIGSNLSPVAKVLPEPENSSKLNEPIVEVGCGGMVCLGDDYLLGSSAKKSTSLFV